MNRFRPIICLFACLAAGAAALPADDPAPSTVVLPAFKANLSQLNIKLIIRYRRRNEGSVVEAVYIRSVKSGSIAEKNGLKKGMELLSIQGQALAGLNTFEMDAACDQAVDDALVLSVRRSPKAAPEEIRIKFDRDSDKP